MNADIKRKILENLGPLIWISLILSLAIIPTIVSEHNESQAFKQLNEQLSQVHSNIEIQSTTANLALLGDSFVYDEQGGTMTGNSQISFNKESNSLIFKISYPSGLERSSKTVELYREKDKSTYQIKSGKYKCNEGVASITLLISGLDTSLNWFLTQTRISPSENGELEVTLEPRSDPFSNDSLQVTRALIGYSPKDNSIQDGIILKYIP